MVDHHRPGGLLNPHGPTEADQAPQDAPQVTAEMLAYMERRSAGATAVLVASNPAITPPLAMAARQSIAWALSAELAHYTYLADNQKNASHTTSEAAS